VSVATWFVRLESASKAGKEIVVTTYKVVIVDAHSASEAELIAARIAFAGPSTMASVIEYAALTQYGTYNKMLLEAKSEYDDWIGQFIHAKNGYYERKPKSKGDAKRN